MGLSSRLMLLMNDGTVRGTGKNYYEEIGVTNISGKSNYSTFQTPDIQGVKKISMSEYHTMFLMEDGTVMGAGKNISNELLPKVGEENKIIKQVDIEKVQDVFAGENCTFFLMNDGTLKAVGSNTNGKLGIGGLSSTTTLVTVPLTDVSKVICGENHTVFLMKDGTIKTAGTNTMGQLGIGNTTPTVNIQNLSLSAKVSDVSCGRAHTVLLMADGTVQGFGYNGFGQLGDGTLQAALTPKSLGKTGVKSVDCGAGFTYLFMTNGTVMSTGDNQRGQLGIGTVTNANTFQSVNITNVKDIVCEGLSAFFLMRDGTLKACGENSSGQFGNSESVLSVANITQLPISGVASLKDALGKIIRYLIQDGINYKAYKNNKWEIVGQSNLNKDIILDGMSSLKDLNNILLSQLESMNPELLVWYEEDPGAKTLTMTGPIWEEVSTTLPTPEEMTLKGHPDLKVIPANAWADLGGDFEVVTYTNDLDETQKLFLEAMPKSQLVQGLTDFTNVAQLALVASAGVKVIVSSDSGVTWKTRTAGNWTTIAATVEDVKASGLSVIDFNLITSDQWTALGDNVRVAYLLEDEALLDKITVTKVQVTDATPSFDGMQVEYEELTLEGRLKDLERLNAINLAKLNFKTNAIMQTDGYKLDDMVIDTFEKDSALTTVSSTDETAEQVFTAPVMLGDGFVSEVVINQAKTPKKIEVR